MQIQTTVRYHHTPIIMAVIENTANNKCYCGEKGTPCILSAWIQITAATIKKNNMMFSQKTKIKLPYEPSISLPGI